MDDVQIENIASVCHEANRQYCKAVLGDDSQPAWEALSSSRKSIIVNGVKFALQNPSASAEQMHANWVDDMTKAGWVYGPKKDEGAAPPTHPAIKPFAELNVSDQRKDQLFLAIVRTVAW